MAKFFSLVVVLILMACLVVGCGGGVQTYVDSDEVVSIGVNEEFVIALDSNPTTGYNWMEVHDGVVLSLVEERYDPDEKAPGLVGAGGTQYFRFKALKAGKTEITVTYKRSWEAESAEQKIFNIDIK